MALVFHPWVRVDETSHGDDFLGFGGSDTLFLGDAPRMAGAVSGTISGGHGTSFLGGGKTRHCIVGVMGDSMNQFFTLKSTSMQ